MKAVYFSKCKAFVPMPEGREYEIYSRVHLECVDAIGVQVTPMGFEQDGYGARSPINRSTLTGFTRSI